MQQLFWSFFSCLLYFTPIIYRTEKLKKCSLNICLNHKFQIPMLRVVRVRLSKCSLLCIESFRESGCLGIMEFVLIRVCVFERRISEVICSFSRANLTYLDLYWIYGWISIIEYITSISSTKCIERNALLIISYYEIDKESDSSWVQSRFNLVEIWAGTEFSGVNEAEYSHDPGYISDEDTPCCRWENFCYKSLRIIQMKFLIQKILEQVESSASNWITILDAIHELFQGIKGRISWKMWICAQNRNNS